MPRGATDSTRYRDGRPADLRRALVEIAQPMPIPGGCVCWAEVASVYQEELRRRIEIARAALPVVARPPGEPVPVRDRPASPQITWRDADTP
jgi:hypothetical protein